VPQKDAGVWYSKDKCTLLNMFANMIYLTKTNRTKYVSNSTYNSLLENSKETRTQGEELVYHKQNKNIQHIVTAARTEIKNC
jgi:hypothetical protein